MISEKLKKKSEILQKELTKNVGNDEAYYEVKKVEDDVTLNDFQKNILNKFLVSDNYETNTTENLYDVIVIGGGGAGLAAACSASQNGS